MIRVRNTEDMYLGIQRRLPRTDKVLARMRNEPDKHIEEELNGQKGICLKEKDWNSMMFVSTQQAVCYYSSKQCDTFTKVGMLGHRAKKKLRVRCQRTEKNREI